jgi:hypothetical protein
VTTFGERLIGLFEILKHNTEVAGFISLAESTQANVYLWAAALDVEIRSMKSGGSEAVVGRTRILDLTMRDLVVYTALRILYSDPVGTEG